MIDCAKHADRLASVWLECFASVISSHPELSWPLPKIEGCFIDEDHKISFDKIRDEIFDESFLLLLQPLSFLWFWEIEVVWPAIRYLVPFVDLHKSWLSEFAKPEHLFDQDSSFWQRKVKHLANRGRRYNMFDLLRGQCLLSPPPIFCQSIKVIVLLAPSIKYLGHCSRS